MSYLKSILRLKLSKVRRLLQPFRISRPPAIDMEDDEEPKSKRPCVEGDKERDTEAVSYTHLTLPTIYSV